MNKREVVEKINQMLNDASELESDLEDALTGVRKIISKLEDLPQEAEDIEE